MANPSATIPLPFEPHLFFEPHVSRMEKLSKRIAELARFMPFAEQEQEMKRFARELNQLVVLFRYWLQSQ